MISWAVPQSTLGGNLPRLAYAEDHILVKLRPQAVPVFAGQSSAGFLSGLVLGLGLPADARLEEPPLGRLLREKERSEAVANLEAPVDLSRFLYLYLPPGMSVVQSIAKLGGHPWVEYAEPDGIGTGGLAPNDPDFSQQWHHTNSTQPGADIHTPQAWNITQGSPTVLVAVLDTGLTDAASEFAGRVVPGYNFADATPDTTDDNGHGTMVAGVLCANANNGTLGAGVDWGCRLIPIKVLNQDDTGLFSWWAQGVDYAVSMGAKVINLSAGGFGSATSLTTAISNAVRQGAIFITITHNDGQGVIRFPGNLPMCITVGATDQNDARAGFSNYGPQIDLVAPGVNISSAGRNGSLEVQSGTSFSAPQVAGVCSLMAALRPNLNQDQARALVCAGADDGVGDATDTAGFDNYYGWGRLNAYNSLLLAQTRIDSIVPLANGQVVLSWPSPPNASDRQPYRISMSTSVDGPWTLEDSTTRFGYTPARTWWTNSGPDASARFYKVQVWQP